MDWMQTHLWAIEEHKLNPFLCSRGPTHDVLGWVMQD